VPSRKREKTGEARPPTSSRTKYRISEKREAARRVKKQEFERAAWQVFSTVGLDTATVRDIVNATSLSPGSFYNYFKTKDVIFETLLDMVIARAKEAILLGRSDEDDLETMLLKGYAASFRELLSLHGAARFFELNQHHIRARLFGSTAVRDMTEDLKTRLQARLRSNAITPDKLALSVSIIFMAGLEGLLHISKNPFSDIDETARFTTALLTSGLLRSFSEP
jgi:AcrR family transcriptional regulator